MPPTSLTRTLRRKLAQTPLFAFNQLLRDRWMTEQACRVPEGSRVLDVGAGSSPYRRLFAHCDYRTQDFAQLEDEQLRHGGYGPIDYVSDATAIPVPDASFDLVLCTEMLEHVPEPIRVVRELARVLKPGGRLLLTAPLGSGLHQEPYHFYGGYTPYWYEKFLAEAGFEHILVQANAGFPRLFSQEAVRFVRVTAPHALEMPPAQRLAWAPLWLLLAPILALGVPLIAAWLDRYDRAPRFTVGYHVTAVHQGEKA